MGHDRTALRMLDQMRIDLRRVSVHEFAHFEVARALGLHGHVQIDHNPEGGLEELHFIGKFVYYERSGKAQLRLVGLAGVVAEHLDEDRDLCGWQLLECIESDVVTLSDTDAANAGRFEECHLDQCIEMVRGAWVDIEQDCELQARTLDLYVETAKCDRSESLSRSAP